MATPPPDSSAVENKPQPSPAVEEVTLHEDLLGGTAVLETKPVTVKLPETMSEPQVNQAVVDENHPLSPAVTGDGLHQPLPNGVNGSAEGADASANEGYPPNSPPTTQETASLAGPEAAVPTSTAPEPEPVLQTVADLPSSNQPEEVFVPLTETLPVVAENEGVSEAPKPSSEPANVLSPSPLNFQPIPENSPVDTTMKKPEAAPASEPLPPSTSENQRSLPVIQKEHTITPPEPQKEEIPSPPAPQNETTPVPDIIPSQPVPTTTNLPSLSPLSPGSTSAAMAALEQEAAPKPEPAEPAEPAPVSETVKPSQVEEQPQEDQEMVDAPPAPPRKVSREREEDVDEEPSSKRAKTDDSAPAAPEFKVPELPTQTAAPASEASQPTSPVTKLQTRFLTRCLQGLKRLHDARFFREPVDAVKLNIPNYPLIIKNPMDLRTMEDKLKQGSYASVDAVIADFNLMIENSVTFNGADHVVSMEGRNLKQNFERHLSKLPKADEVEVTPAEKKAKKTATAPTKTQPARRESRGSAGNNARPAPAVSPTTTFALGPEGLPLIRRDSSTADGRPKRSIHPPKNRELPYSAKPKKKKYQWELKFCQEVLDELHKPKHYLIAAPFYHPVDPVALNIPTYHSVIKKPMDLQTVQTKLRTGQYENAKEMEADIRLIFKNCYKFNIPGDPTFNAGKSMEELFDNKWSQKRRWIEAHEPTSGHQSPGTSDNGSDSEGEDSEEDNDQEKLNQLQKQIAEMSKQVEAITQKKKKTPPSSTKKSSKSKSTKKDTAKKGSGGGTGGGASGRKDNKKSGSKSSKSEKQHWVTYREKQIISNGISSLPEKRMTEALKIIQSNVPGLKDTKEAEIELDIDELPNEVLLVLLKFVKKHAPAAMEIDEPEPDPAPIVASSKPKKNKPMSKYEQEARINSIEGTISRFQGGGGKSQFSPEPIQSVEAAESSEDDDDSEESEEE
ncbi:hypothetical protein ACO22_00013 [Paracoccidioides brasiliensis]|uniref:Uncharacterized protein n=1 Tax=Paracoccidioides brasiliensis TaxID=121759 RepID=A0A1D2JQI3_PARBR|nr:hypothetical protein ACO22_00013 [Paracoccidioides brasiliensis]ODH49316.1 hypothetical protein GX48_04527 [Paracoccidioides brasiliensis]